MRQLMDTNQNDLSIQNYLKGNSLTLKSLFYKDDQIFWKHILDSNNLDINLDGINYIQHDGAIWIAYIAAYRKFTRKITDITLPTNPDVIGYLKSINFNIIADGTMIHFNNSSDLEHYPPKYIYSKKEEQNLAKLISIQSQRLSISPKEINFLLKDYLLSVAFPEFKSKDIGYLFESLFSTTINEIIKNITDYGGEKLGDGIGYCSLMPSLRQENFMRYCFFDIGKGFRTTLLEKKNDSEYKKLGNIDDDKTAIIKGLLFRQAIKSENIIGLYPVLGIICATKGKIGVRSGNAIVEIDFSQAQTYDNFRNNFFKGFDRSIDESLKLFFNRIIQYRNVESVIPGSQIYVDIGITKENIDTLFLEEISRYLEARSMHVNH
jgi:hypothetical protein